MRASISPPVSLISCSIFQLEVNALVKQDFPDLHLHYLNSMLHMRPELLDQKLGKIVAAELARAHKVLLVYGDCFPYMFHLEKQPGVLRTPAHNCCELILGKTEYRRMEHAGVFFLLPEWARCWRRIFSHHLGMNAENMKDLMQEMHQKLVYLDTGLVPIPLSDLSACSNYCGLSLEVIPVSLDHLRTSILETYHRLRDSQ